MSNNFDPQDFQVLITEDGTPTLKGATGEPMHSLRGALSETQYIYGPVVQEVISKSWPPRFLSLGLGLGYVELVTLAMGAQQQLPWEKFYLHTFESEKYLRQCLQKFFEGAPGSNPLYAKVLSSVAEAFAMEPESLHRLGRRLLQTGVWVIDQALESPLEWSGEKFSGIFFDAFSSKSSPQLWTQEFLEDFLSTYAGSKCSLSTYAATGPLRRALAAQGFEVRRPPGFGGKRQCVRAVRAMAHLETGPQD